MSPTIPTYIRRLLGRPETGADALMTEAAPVEIERAFDSALLDPDAVRVVQRLKEAGFEAYLVGGCVRDLLFDLRPKDFDVVTSAHPAQIKKLFRNCRIIGRRFRLAHVYYRDNIIEVATFRTRPAEPGENEDLLIRDDNEFGTAQEDALRRDFTVNALFYDLDRSTILDYVGGVADAERREIRTIGDPAVRFREDPIRMLRAIRLAARLGARIEPETWSALCEHRDAVLDAASPRIGEDILRMFRGGAIAPAFDLMRDSEMLKTLLPELDAHFADQETDEDVRAYRRALRWIDKSTAREKTTGTAVQLALLLSPYLMGEVAEAPARDIGKRLTSKLTPLAQRLSISRRDSERIRQILQAVHKMATVKNGRLSAALFRRAYFPEALELFRLLSDATGDRRDDVERWTNKLADAPAAPDKPAAPVRKRRSRRGRRGGRSASRQQDA